MIIETDKNIVKEINELLSSSSPNSRGGKIDESILQMFGYHGSKD